MRRPLLLALAAGACDTDWPDASRGDALGPEAPGVEQGPLHRPGQPCLWCHGGPAARAPLFTVAGTIYRGASDPVGVEGAELRITDDDGQTLTLVSNAAGNLYVHADLQFPLRVTVLLGGVEKPMRSVIGRDGSCAGCHLDPPGAAIVGRVFVEDPP